FTLQIAQHIARLFVTPASRHCAHTEMVAMVVVLFSTSLESQGDGRSTRECTAKYNELSYGERYEESCRFHVCFGCGCVRGGAAFERGRHRSEFRRDRRADSPDCHGDGGEA